MVTKIQSVHFTADQKLILMIEEKLEKLNHYFKPEGSAEVILKMEKVKIVKTVGTTSRLFIVFQAPNLSLQRFKNLLNRLLTKHIEG